MMTDKFIRRLSEKALRERLSLAPGGTSRGPYALHGARRPE